MCTLITRILRPDACFAPAGLALFAVAAGVSSASGDSLGILTPPGPIAAGAHSLGVLEHTPVRGDRALVVFAAEAEREFGSESDRDALIRFSRIAAGSMPAAAGAWVPAVRFAPESIGAGEGSIWGFTGEFTDLDEFDGIAQQVGEVIGSLDAGSLLRGQAPVSRVPVGIAPTDEDQLLVVPLPPAALVGLAGLALVCGVHCARRAPRVA